MDVNSPEAALWSENMRLKSENENLRAAAERVCWFDWSGNDPDASAAIDELRRVIEQPAEVMPGTKEGKQDANMEPRIQIGNYVLTSAQAMAVRVAVMNFHLETANPEFKEGLGPIADAYHERLSEILPFLSAHGQAEDKKHGD